MQLLGDEDPEEAPLLGNEEGGHLILQVEQRKARLYAAPLPMEAIFYAAPWWRGPWGGSSAGEWGGEPPPWREAQG